MKLSFLRLTPVLLFAIVGQAAEPPAAPAAGAEKSRPDRPDRLRAYVTVLRAELSDGKTNAINQVMNLSDQEAKVFWPIYHDYEDELFANGDKRLELIKQYVALHSTKSLTNDKAREISAAWFDFQSRQLELLKKYHAQIQEQLSPIRAAQFAQLEHRFSLVVDLMIASDLPLIENETRAAEADSKPADAVPAKAEIKGK